MQKKSLPTPEAQRTLQLAHNAAIRKHKFKSPGKIPALIASKARAAARLAEKDAENAHYGRKKGGVAR